MPQAGKGGRGAAPRSTKAPKKRAAPKRGARGQNGDGLWDGFKSIGSSLWNNAGAIGREAAKAAAAFGSGQGGAGFKQSGQGFKQSGGAMMVIPMRQRTPLNLPAPMKGRR
jgi:hypothetical protein